MPIGDSNPAFIALSTNQFKLNGGNGNTKKTTDARTGGSGAKRGTAQGEKTGNDPFAALTSLTGGQPGNVINSAKQVGKQVFDFGEDAASQLNPNIVATLQNPPSLQDLEKMLAEDDQGFNANNAGNGNDFPDFFNSGGFSRQA